MLPRIQRIPRTRSAMSEAARALVDRLGRLEPGALVTYEELSAIAGVDVQTRRDLLYTAFAYLRQEEGFVFDPDTGVGYVRLTESGKIGRGRRKRGMLHRAALKNTEELKTVDYGPLTPLEKYQWLAESSISAAVTLATHEKTARQIEAQHTPQPIRIDPRDYQDLFKGL
jgi:hypothetical protein